MVENSVKFVCFNFSFLVSSSRRSLESDSSSDYALPPDDVSIQGESCESDDDNRKVHDLEQQSKKQQQRTPAKKVTQQHSAVVSCNWLLFAISLHFISQYYSAKTSHLFFSCNIPQFPAHFYPFLTLLLVHCSFVRTLCFEAKFFLLLFASKT